MLFYFLVIIRFLVSIKLFKFASWAKVPYLNASFIIIIIIIDLRCYIYPTLGLSYLKIRKHDFLLLIRH